MPDSLKTLARLAALAGVLWAAALPTASPAAAAGDLAGKVVAVADGDTLTLLTPDRAQVKVRLTEIDAPEGGQAWGDRSRRQLSALVLGQQVRVETRGQDRYGRTLGRVFAGPADVSAEMVRNGAAWAYLAHLTDRRMVALEAEARQARRGLWAMPANELTPPWDWRREKREGIQVASLARTVPAPPETRAQLAALTAEPLRRQAPRTAASAAVVCGTKTYCRQMIGCAEAKAYLAQCRAPIDGDGDGVPCEAICRR